MTRRQVLLVNPRMCSRGNFRLPLSLLALGSVLEGKHAYQMIDGSVDDDAAGTALRAARRRVGADRHRPEPHCDRRIDERQGVARGAEIVAGAHPHVVQREERLGGATILHSLGNAVYPEELKGADSGVVRVVELP